MSTLTKPRRKPVKVRTLPGGLTEVLYSVNGQGSPKPKVWQSITRWLRPSQRSAARQAAANGSVPNN